MSKLFKLKPWLTLPECAKRLSMTFEEAVSVADVLQLALNCKLVVSTMLVGGAYASICKPIENEDDLVWNEMPNLSGTGIIRIPAGGQVIYAESGQMLQVQKGVFSMEDHEPYDLMMLGGERADVEREYWGHVGHGIEDSTNIDGVFLSQGIGRHKQYFQLKDALPRKDVKEERTYYPIGSLPETSVLVVRPGALIEFEQSLKGESGNVDKPLSTTERNTLLKLVIGMAVKGYSHDTAASKSTAPKEIADDLAALGISVTDDTVRKYLKQAADSVLPAKPRQS